MRILRLHIRNLNSLRGDHPIDFTAAPLADHSLYAIVGPTGAGKTTILDAITLALYGQTERNKSEVDRKDGSGTVLTYGEGECLAELEYEVVVGGKLERYRSAWTRQRAHKKPDGKLTASKHSISRFNPASADEENPWTILATKKREVADVTQEIVGLDYERFVRSVMLTQGDFARFLKSDAGNKAEILEKITGTEIYRDLSVAAFTRAKLAREAHDRATEALATMPPLATEERQRLDEQLTARTTEVVTFKNELSTITRQLGLYDQLWALQTKSVVAKTGLARLESNWAALTADRDRLNRSDALQSLRPDLDADLRLRSETQRLTTELAATDEQRTSLETAVTTATAAIATAQEKMDDYHKKLPAREKKFAAVAKLEQEIAGLVRDVELEEKRQQTVLKSRRECQARERELKKQLAIIAKELAGMEPPAIREKLEGLDASLPASGTAVETLDRRIARRKTADRLATETASATVLAATLQQAATTTATTSTALIAAETALADRRLTLNNLLVSASLAEHKHHLTPGEECPVCGATEHPALKDFQPVTDSAVERTKADANRALGEVDAARQQLKQAQQAEVVLQRKYDGHTALLAELTAQLGTDVVTETESVVELTGQRTSLADQLVKDIAEQARLRRLQAKLPQLTALGAELRSVTERVLELDAELKTIATTLAQTNETITAKRVMIKTEVGDHTAEQCRELTRKKKDALTADLAAAEKAAVEQKGQLATLTAQRKALENQLEKGKAELVAVQERLVAALRERELTAASARLSLLSEGEVLQLRSRLKKAETERTTALALDQNLTTDIALVTQAVADLPDRTTLDKVRAEQAQAASEGDRLIGAISLQIRQDDQRIADTADRRLQIEGLRKEADRWAVMSKLIGSADGKKFRSHAQAITLQRLIDVGNDHLRSISPRYRMEYAAPAGGSGENLDIIIVDTYHDDNRRTMATLSGGETFLISLALALGLSDLASGKNLIQSLFIDEGFGTLDGKTLDQAMTTLEQLRDQGKTIGLISHVASLRERIQCQIQLEPVGDGFSRIEVVG